MCGGRCQRLQKPQVGYTIRAFITLNARCRFESRHTAVVPDVEWIRGFTSGTRHSFPFIVTLTLYRSTNQQQLVTPTNYISLLNLVDSLVSTFCFDSNMNETKLSEEKRIIIQQNLSNTCFFCNLIRVYKP